MIKLIDIFFENVCCCSRPKAPLLLENAGKTLISEHIQYHIQNKLPLTENTFRYGSKSFLNLWNEARNLHNNGIIKLDGDDRAIIEETEIGKLAIYEGKVIPLDLIIEENLNEAAKPKKKTPPIGKPKRGGSKKFYVYVRDKGKVKKVSFGDTSGLSAKINNPAARRAFAARHDCKNKKDRTKASYWSCRLPRFAKLLGLKSSFSGFW
jgi:hypothetical protein